MLFDALMLMCFLALAGVCHVAARLYRGATGEVACTHGSRGMQEHVARQHVVTVQNAGKRAGSASVGRRPSSSLRRFAVLHLPSIYHLSPHVLLLRLTSLRLPLNVLPVSVCIQKASHGNQSIHMGGSWLMAYHCCGGRLHLSWAPYDTPCA